MQTQERDPVTREEGEILSNASLKFEPPRITNISEDASLSFRISANADANVILELRADGEIFWRGRKIESDATFRAAVIDLVQHYMGLMKLGSNANAAATLELIEELRLAKQREYNPFEPNNQSEAYKRIDRVLSKYER
jgi:hypothetical protein